MKIKIVSDGTAIGTQIIDADTGANLSETMRCTRIVIDATEGIAVATLTVDAPLFDCTTERTPPESIETLRYDSDDIEAMDRAIAELQRQRAAKAGQ